VIPVTSAAGSLLKGELQSCCREHHDTTKRELERRFALGQCTAADLRLDSKLAIELARGRERRYGEDGRILEQTDPTNVERTYPTEAPPEPVQWAHSDDEAEAAAPSPRARCLSTWPRC
jgi:hypothetical protein